MADVLAADFGGQQPADETDGRLPSPAAFLFPAKSANSLFRQFAIPLRAIATLRQSGNAGLFFVWRL